MKHIAFLTVVLLTVTAGCVAPGRDWASHHGEPGSKGQRVRAYLVKYTDEAELEKFTDPDLEFDDELFEDLEHEIAIEMIVVPDPFEGWNRLMFDLNDAVYVSVAKPIMEGYVKLVPLDVRLGIRNVFNNANMPIRAINCCLQGRWNGAGKVLTRFGINTTVGILGVVNVARDRYGLNPVVADAAQTLASYGLKEGCYLVWPFFGPSTLRDSAGFVADRFMDPLFYFSSNVIVISVGMGRRVNAFSFRFDTFEAITADALDPYVAVRQAYLQFRRNRNAMTEMLLDPEPSADPDLDLDENNPDEPEPQFALVLVRERASDRFPRSERGLTNRMTR